MMAISNCKLKFISILCTNCHSYTGSCQGFQARIGSVILYIEYSTSIDNFAESAEIWIKAIIIRLKSHNFPSDIYNIKQQFISANIFLAQRSRYTEFLQTILQANRLALAVLNLDFFRIFICNIYICFTLTTSRYFIGHRRPEPELKPKKQKLNFSSKTIKQGQVI